MGFIHHVSGIVNLNRHVPYHSNVGCYFDHSNQTCLLYAKWMIFPLLQVRQIGFLLRPYALFPSTEPVTTVSRCCLPTPLTRTPLTLVSGGSSIFRLMVYQPASSSVHLVISAVTSARSVHESRGDNVVRGIVVMYVS